MNQTSLICGLITAVTGLSVMSTPVAAQTVLYKAAKVYTMIGEPLSPGQVLVVDGKIADVGQELKATGDVEIIDLGDGVLVPGFVDPYSQAGLAGGTDEFTSEITPEFDTARFIDWKDLALRRSLYAGTTTVAVYPGTENVVAGTSTIIKTAGVHETQRRLKNQGGLVISLCSDPRRRNSARSRPDGLYVRQPTNRMGVVWILRSTFDGVKRSETSSTGNSISAALNAELPLYAVSRTSNDLTALLSLSKEFEIAPTVIGGQEAYLVARQLAAANVPVILGPLSAGVETGPEGTVMAWNNAGRLAEAGVTIALSGGNLLDQARFAHRFGLSEEASLKAITQTPAQLLGVADRVGVIAPGIDADMVALDGNPLDLTTAIRWVMVNGTVFQL